jgi:hypothetical protein
MNPTPRAFVVVVAFAMALGSAGPSIAHQDDPRLDQLFQTSQELDRPTIREVRTLEPRHVGGRAGLGPIYMRLDRPKDALDAMRAGLKVHPHMPGVEAFAEELRKRVEDKGIQ